MVGGYAGSILRIDLTRNEFRRMPLEFRSAKKYLGGRGLAARTLFNELAPTTDPLDSNNIIVFATGPLTGCPIPGANRTVAVTKSPETGIFLDTYAGGSLGPEIKFAGYDFIVIQGRCTKPTYVRIFDDQVSFKDASGLWGIDCWETETILKDDVGDKEAKVAVIGPAGEKLVKFACISTDYFHQFGRGGAGAVMGAKNLKGIVIRGTGSLEIAEWENLKNILIGKIEWKLTQGPGAEMVRDRIMYGTTLTTDLTQQIGILPTRNFQQGQFEKAEEIDAASIRRKLPVTEKACYCCNMPCGKFRTVPRGPYRDTSMLGPEYETIAMLGPNIGTSELEAILKANVLCDKAGMDTISTGNVIGFAMECFERGTLTKRDASGLQLKFGNIKEALELIELIAARQGIGDTLAEGVRAASQRIGRNSVRFAMQSKGMEYPAYEPRGSAAFALFYAICDRGACHRRGWPIIEENRDLEYGTIRGRPELVKDLYDYRNLLHCLIVCDFPYSSAGITRHDIANMLSAVTGWRTTLTELCMVTNRTASLIRCFNIREGVRRSDDTLAWRTMHEPLQNGPMQGRHVTKKELDKMLNDYYKLRGWNKKTGIPTAKTLSNLGLGNISKDLRRSERHVQS